MKQINKDANNQEIINTLRDAVDWINEHEKTLYLKGITYNQEEREKHIDKKLEEILTKEFGYADCREAIKQIKSVCGIKED